MEGKREIVIKEVAVTALRPPLCPPTMLSTHEWDQVTEDGKVHENSIPETLLKGTEEEAIDLNSEVLMLFSLFLPTNYFLPLVMAVSIFILSKL